MKTNMITIKNLKTNETRSFSSLYEAAKSVAGQKYEKTEQDYIKRLARFQWVVDSNPAPSTTPIVEQIAKALASVSIDPEAFNALSKKVEDVSDQVFGHRNKVADYIQENAGRLISIIDRMDRIEEAVNNRKIDEIVIKQEAKADIRVKGQHKQFGTLLRIISCRLNAILIGAAGSGKTTAAEKVAETLSIPYYSMSVGSQTTKHEFFGYRDANGNYHRTLFREAFENGGIFLIDEMDAGNANVLVSINQALANEVCAFPDNMVHKHPDFVVIASANTWGSGASREYVGRNQLDAATKDRFIPILWEYDQDLEDAITPNKEWLAEVRRVRRAVDKFKIRQIISPRASIYGSKLLAAGMEWDEVRKMVLLKDMSESEVIKINESK